MATPTDTRNTAPSDDPRKQADTVSEARPLADNTRVEKHTLTPSDSGDARHRLIAEAAYRMAERRGFVDGYDLQDWFAAEREVDELLEADRLQSAPDAVTTAGSARQK
jgi:hypothetical protein